MCQSRRTVLANIQPAESMNAGLWLDKYMDRTEREPNQILVDEIVKFGQKVSGYEKFFDLWKTALEKAGVGQFKQAHTLNRLAINLGADSVLETNLALHRTYGVPYIPGSALKGLAAHFAHQYLKDPAWRKGGEAHQVVFGDTNTAGYITFFDALYVPSSGKNGKALWKDVITVHHAAYYQSGAQPPADYDSTTVIPFLTATGSFLIALAGPDEWVEKTYQILELALKEEGIGAKTSSGYGRMCFEENVAVGPRPKPKEHYEIEKRRLMAESPPAGRIRGVVIKVIDKPGSSYAFTKPQGGGGEHYINCEVVEGGYPLKMGQVLEYTLEKTEKTSNKGIEVVVLLEK